MLELKGELGKASYNTVVSKAVCYARRGGQDGLVGQWNRMDQETHVNIVTEFLAKVQENFSGELIDFYIKQF